MPTLYVLIGPTAVGKTEMALRWAERKGAEILSCDAFCVYRGMDIGTAKPTTAEQARVPHHGIDLTRVDHPFSVSDYVEEAARVVEDCRARRKPLLVTGGSGFYAKCFFSPVTDSTAVSASVRQEVRKLGDEEGLKGLLHALLKLNPDGIEGVDLQNPRRVQTALERCLASGKTVAELQQEYRAQTAPFPDFKKQLVVLTRSREDLNARIDRRTALMIEQGLIDEVKRLRDEGLELNPSAAAAIGYREVLDWLDCGDGDKLALAEAIAANTKRLAKKQLSFFRNQLPSGHWIDLTESDVEVDTLFDQPAGESSASA